MVKFTTNPGRLCATVYDILIWFSRSRFNRSYSLSQTVEKKFADRSLGWVLTDASSVKAGKKLVICRLRKFAGCACNSLADLKKVKSDPTYTNCSYCKCTMHMVLWPNVAFWNVAVLLDVSWLCFCHRKGQWNVINKIRMQNCCFSFVGYSAYENEDV